MERKLSPWQRVLCASAGAFELLNIVSCSSKPSVSLEGPRSELTAATASSYNPNSTMADLTILIIPLPSGGSFFNRREINERFAYDLTVPTIPGAEPGKLILTKNGSFSFAVAENVLKDVKFPFTQVFPPADNWEPIRVLQRFRISPNGTLFMEAAIGNYDMFDLNQPVDSYDFMISDMPIKVKGVQPNYTASPGRIWWRVDWRDGRAVRYTWNGQEQPILQAGQGRN